MFHLRLDIAGNFQLSTVSYSRSSNTMMRTIVVPEPLYISMARADACRRFNDPDACHSRLFPDPAAGRTMKARRRVHPSMAA